MALNTGVFAIDLWIGRNRSLFGVYPDISLAEARDKAHEARKMLANDVDPGADKQNKKRAQKLAAANTFEAVAREWFQKNSTKWVESHGGRVINRLEKDVFPYVGNRPITELSAPEILTVLQRIESRGAIETAHRTHQNFGQIFRYAIATGYAQNDPSLTFEVRLNPFNKNIMPALLIPRKLANCYQLLIHTKDFL